jgi:hypothetical protein
LHREQVVVLVVDGLVTVMVFVMAEAAMAVLDVDGGSDSSHDDDDDSDNFYKHRMIITPIPRPPPAAFRCQRCRLQVARQHSMHPAHVHSAAGAGAAAAAAAASDSDTIDRLYNKLTATYSSTAAIDLGARCAKRAMCDCQHMACDGRCLGTCKRCVLSELRPQASSNHRLAAAMSSSKLPCICKRDVNKHREAAAEAFGT